jgi:hypothetical protein
MSVRERITTREVSSGLIFATIEVSKNMRKVVIVHAPITTMSLYPVTYSHSSSAGFLLSHSGKCLFHGPGFHSLFLTCTVEISDALTRGSRAFPCLLARRYGSNRLMAVWRNRNRRSERWTFRRRRHWASANEENWVD